jgi:hypothetical protein
MPSPEKKDRKIVMGAPLSLILLSPSSLLSISDGDTPEVKIGLMRRFLKRFTKKGH